MIKLFRKIRYELLESNKIGKYLKYAFGEIILVVIGILIAIQINNSNQKRLNQEALEGYLNSIAQNLESDLKRAERINKTRLELFPRVYFVNRRMAPDYYQIASEVYGLDISFEDRYSVENIDFMARAINDSWSLLYLTPNLSGFESLKSSGFLSQLQGTDLEILLFDYYNQVDELIIFENNYNDGLKSSFEDFANAGLEGTFAFFSPGTQDWRNEFGERFPELMDEIIQHPTLIPVFRWNYDIIIKYENLLLTGKALHQMIVSRSKSFTPEIKKSLEAVHDEYGDRPYPKIMRNGVTTSGNSYGVASAQGNTGVNIQFLDSLTAVQFYPQAWGVYYSYVGDGVIDPNRIRDFSSFDTLRIKMRGTEGGEAIQIALKDKSNPTDGSETKVPLTLGKEWKNYDIPLTSFAPTNLEELFIVASIIVENKALTVEIKDIEYR
jgi:hypothetical protein